MMAVETSAIKGMVKGRMLRPLCHSHSAAMASAKDLLGTFASGAALKSNQNTHFNQRRRTNENK